MVFDFLSVLLMMCKCYIYVGNYALLDIKTYSSAETWFGILFVTLVEVSPHRVKSSVLGIFLFLMNNAGGNLPVLLDPLSKMVGYRQVSAIIIPCDRKLQGGSVSPLPGDGRAEWLALSPCHSAFTISHCIACKACQSQLKDLTRCF